MNAYRTVKLIAVLSVCGGPALVFANGMRLVSQDGFASARGEAFVATADNPSAIYYNPAGITQIEGDSLRSGMYSIYLDPSFEPPATAPNAGKTYHLRHHYAFVPQTFYTHTFEDLPLSFGAGLYAPYGASISWPQDTGFRSIATEGRVTYIRFNPVVAYKVLPKLSLAAGMMVDYADTKLDQGLLSDAQPLANSFRFSGNGFALGYNVGVLWQPHEKISFGATVRSSTTVNFDGKTEFQQQPIIQPTRLSAEMEMEFPLTAVVGISYRPTPKWNIEFNADYTDWDSMDHLRIKQGGTPPFPVKQDIPVILNWEDSWIFSLGATRYLENGWHVSAGYVFNQNSVPDDYYSPLAADLDRHFVSVGAGRKGRRFDFDVMYQFGYGPSRTVSGSLPSSQPATFSGQTADGKWEFMSHAVLVTVGIHF